MTYNPLKKIDEFIDDINHDSYFLTRDDQASIEVKLQELRKYIKELYLKKGQKFE